MILQVSALVDYKGTAKNVAVRVILTGLNDPNGVATCNGTLWVAEGPRITRYDRADDYILAGKVMACCSWPLPLLEPMRGSIFIAPW